MSPTCHLCNHKPPDLRTYTYHFLIQKPNHTTITASKRQSPSMRITIIFIAAANLVASAAAQSTTTTGTAAAASTNDLPSMVSEIPQCALGCLNTAAQQINCNAADLTCLCSNSNAFIKAIGPCIVFSSGCSSDEQSGEYPAPAPP